MVKRQKEKQYLSHREQRDHQALRSFAGTGTTATQALPFSHCALTLQPFQDPVLLLHNRSSNKSAVLFERDALTAFVFCHKQDPVTGEKASTQDIFAVEMARDDGDDDDIGDNKQKNSHNILWQCPVLQKPLSDRVKIVAIVDRKDKVARVYSFEAYRELCVLPQNYQDLTTGRPFDKAKDVLILNDPGDDNSKTQQQRDLSQFYHIRHERELKEKEEREQGGSGKHEDIRHSRTASRVLDKLQKNKRKREQEKEKEPQTAPQQSSKQTAHDLGDNVIVLAQDVTGVQFNTAQGASSFTSTGVTLQQDAQLRPATDEEIRQAEFRVMTTQLKGRKGYAQMNLSVAATEDEGSPSSPQRQTFSMTLELHCDIAPRTCANFLGLCQEEEYDGCTFHRLIPNFMLQGGSQKHKKDNNDDNGKDDTDKQQQKDECLWGGTFADEFDDRLCHDGPGIVSMANSGPNTNARQFFVTFAACAHLDRKHTVFGRVIRGVEHLKTLQAIPTSGKNNVPRQEIVIESLDVMENPAQIAHDMEQQRLKGIVDARQQQNRQTPQQAKPADAAATKSPPPPTTKQKDPSETGVGRSKVAPAVGQYLQSRLRAAANKTGSGKRETSIPKKPPKRNNASNEDTVTTQQQHRLPPPPKKTKFKDFSGW